ncbi:MAG: helix-turn-helix transcriptional regulator [Acidobacteria bacterium]|nr:helix-turn-helix transcriptional regulator [Pseudomonadota bacterium]MBS1867995.1 helix-turn-helix transcriptional regulator [Acidobacteriota bacterium]
MTRSTNHPSYQAFLTLLRAERRKRHVTQVELAERLGNRQTFVSKLENGDRRLDVVELLEYLDAVGADTAEFIATLKRRTRMSSRDRKLAIRTTQGSQIKKPKA